MKPIKHILFFLFFLVLLCELLQNSNPWHHSFRALHGEFVPEPKPKLTLDNWLSGNFQEHGMKYFEQNLDVRPILIRLHNQIDYSLFNKINAENIEEGKDRNLFGSGYIESYLGQNFIGEEKIKRKAEMLAYVQKELKKRNIDLVFVIAPGKPSIFPELLPPKYDLSKKTRTNYDAFTEQLEKQSINHIDFTKYFLNLKPKVKHPLFTRCGVHWSGYGTTVSADTLIKYMEKLRNIDMPDYYETGGLESTTPRNTDADLGDLLNLLHDIPSYKMYYPNIIFKTEPKKVKPNVLIVGDSFVWSWISFYNYFPNLFNNKSAFWYYGHDVGWSPTDQNKTLVADMNLKEQVLQRDYILIVNNESGLNNPGGFFIDNLFEMLHADSDTLTITK